MKKILTVMTAECLRIGNNGDRIRTLRFFVDGKRVPRGEYAAKWCPSADKLTKYGYQPIDIRDRTKVCKGQSVLYRTITYAN